MPVRAGYVRELRRPNIANADQEYRAGTPILGAWTLTSTSRMSQRKASQKRKRGVAHQFAAPGELPVILSSLRFQEEHLMIDSRFPCGVGDLPFHPVGI
jgi:hypothetical protein